MPNRRRVSGNRLKGIYGATVSNDGGRKEREEANIGTDVIEDCAFGEMLG